MPLPNNPGLVAELARLHDAYERALSANDLGTLAAFFWDSPEAVRFGVGEESHGAGAIAAFRRTHRPGFTDRRLARRRILLTGEDSACILAEYLQRADGRPQRSRQMQAWVRFPGLGWRIVAAHVSVRGEPESAGADEDGRASATARDEA